MLDDLVDVQATMDGWLEDEGTDVIEQMYVLLQEAHASIPAELSMRDLLRTLEKANSHVSRSQIANNAFGEMLEMTSDP